MSNLTERQLLIWVKEKLNPDIAANNMVMTFTISGALDPKRFRAAFGSVVAEFDALRTVIAENERGIPQQRVLDLVPASVDVVDLSAEDNVAEAFETWRGRRCSRPLSLEVCGFDCALVRLGSKLWVWYLCQNHIITDGKSFSLIYQHVAARYESPDADLPEAASFEEYRALEQTYRNSEWAKVSEEYWQEKLDSPVEPIRLYGQQPSENIVSTRRLSLNLGAERCAAIRDLAARPESRALTADLSLSLLFTTVLFAYLHRVSGNSRIGMVMPVLNRKMRKVRDTVGLLMELVALHVDVDSEDTFLSLLEKVRDELYTVMQHSQFGVPSMNRPVDVMINFHNAVFPPFCGWPTRTTSSTGLNSPDRSSESYWRSDETFSLQIQNFNNEDSFTLDFDFNADIFSAELAQRAVRHFEILLDAMVAELRDPIHGVDLVEEAERKIALRDFNPDPIELGDDTLIDAFEDVVRRSPNRVALSFGDKEFSYRQLSERSAEIARQLMEAGVRGGDRVAVLLERSLELPAALLGVMRSGAAYVPIDPEHPIARNEMILEDAAPRVLLTQSNFSTQLSSRDGMELLCVDRSPPVTAFDSPLPKVSSGDLAYVIFTSGSTGRPKGVQITHSNLMNFLVAMLDEPGMDENDVVVCVTTVAFDIVGLDFYVTWLAGGECVLADRPTALDPRRLEALLARSGATVLQATPATFRMLLDVGWKGREELRVLTGGEALSREMADDLLDRCAGVWNLYGPTETTVWCTTERVEPCGEVLPDQTPPSIPIGRPIRNKRLYVLDAMRRPVPIGVQGEIWIGGAGVGLGYCGRPDLTQEVYVDDPFGAPGDRMYRSGDLGRHRSDGRVEYTGRADYQVKIRGFRVELAEIERVIDSEPTVHECVVVARQDAETGMRLIAYLTGARGIDPDVASLRAHLRSHLPAYMIPADFVVLDAMPLSPTGKISRADLPEPEIGRPQLGMDYVAPVGELEQSLTEMWSDLLHLEPIGVHDSYFDLGGHSLAALSLFRRIKRELGVELPMATLFEAPTVRELAAVIQRAASGDVGIEWSTLVAIQPEGTRLPIYCAAGLGGHITNLERLAKRLGFDQPFFGLQTRGVDGQELHACVEDIAQESIADVKALQPQGPYVLAGYSAGGAVALEMARQLRDAGDEIASLILLDSYSPIVQRRTKWQRFGIHIARLRDKGPGYLTKKVVDRARHDVNRMRSVGNRVRARLFPERYAHERFMHKRLEVQLRYRPDPYPGGATLFRVNRDIESSNTGFAIDEFNGWLPLIQGGVEVIPAPGGHLDMCEEPHVRELADQLAKILDPLNEDSCSDEAIRWRKSS